MSDNTPAPSAPEGEQARALADELLQVQFDIDPVWPAMLGIDTSRAGLGAITEEEEQRGADAVRDVLRRARELEPTEPEDRLTRDVVISLAQAHLDRVAAREVEYTVTDIFVAPAVGMLTTLPMLQISGPEHAESYLGRLRDVPRYLAGALERHRAGVAAGRVPVAHLVDAAVRHLDRHLSDPGNDPLARPAPPDGVDVGDFHAERERLLRDVVRPAIRQYRDGLVEHIAPHARPEDKPGLAWLPDGERIYRLLAGVHTTVDRDPAELHQVGLDLIDRLADEYAEVGSRVFGTTDLGEIFHRLRTDPALRWSSAEELIEHANAAIRRAEQAAPQWFGRIPTQPWVVEEVPAAAAPGAPAAYYMAPSADGSRPGTYFANTYQVTERFKHTAEVTAFHEAIPGHHFQISLALSLDDIPLLRRVNGFTAYVEGWGLYTERLAQEMGLYSGDVALLGMLSMDSLRAGRLVVDTGLHAKGWSREQAIDYLRTNSPMPLVEIEAEVDRYIAYPGQALSYMVGRLEILRMRQAAERRLGDRFDIRAFHDVVLGSGAVPLGVLDTLVGEWVERQ